jgi:hypothetical protein
MICQDCGIEAQTKHVTFHQNIGAFILRFPTSIEGNLCKACIHKHFWTMTPITMLMGWWGVISFIVTPFFLLNNIGRYLFCLGMAPAPPGAVPPRLTDDAVARINIHASELFGRLNGGEDFAQVASEIANRVGVTPGQVALYVQAVINASSQA